MNIMPPFELWFVIAVTILNGFGFVIWKRNDWFNTILKVVLFVLTIWGVILIYNQGFFS